LKRPAITLFACLPLAASVNGYTTLINTLLYIVAQGTKGTTTVKVIHEPSVGIAGVPMSPGIARMVVASTVSPATTNPYQQLPREKTVLSFMARENSYEQIAAEFGIGVDTVRTHLKKVYEKLQVHSQIEAVSKAIHERLV
jgi:DNA-binding NarL/FixJ family response regulator